MSLHCGVAVVSILLMANVPEASDADVTREATSAGQPHDEPRRQGRIFSFNSDKNEIRIELGFSIPFVNIPVGSTAADGSLVNVNLGAIATGGLLSAAAILVAPSMFDGLAPIINFARGGRSEAAGGAGLVSTWLSALEDALRRHDIDATSCVQKTICWLAQESRRRVEDGTASAADKILDGVASIQWLERMVSGTAVEDSLRAARRGVDCGIAHPGCTVSREALVRAVSGT